MLQDVAAGMAYLHSRKCVHGDLRSQTLFVRQDGQVGLQQSAHAILQLACISNACDSM